jgi:hypothetical protein
MVLGFHNSAQAKPKVAVLGLEVIDNGDVDKKTTDAAKNLAAAIRRQASQGNGKYELAPNSADKSLLELKLLSNCTDEGRTCMAEIGKELKADRLLYGKLERRKRGNYQVSLKLLNTNTHQMEKTTSELISGDELRSAKINKWAKKLYSRLIGLPESGTLRLDANVDKATVYINDKVATTLREGSAKVAGLDEGVHTVAIEADGYQRYEADIEIRAGETETMSVGLIEIGSAIDEGPESRLGWKVGFSASAVATVGAGAAWLYYARRAGYLGGTELLDAKDDAWRRLRAEDRTVYDEIVISSGADPNDSNTKTVSGACEHAEGKTSSAAAFADFQTACSDGKTAATRSTIFGIGTGLAAAALAYTGYKAWIADGGKEGRAMANGRSNKPNLVITPQVSADSIGAGLALEF